MLHISLQRLNKLSSLIDMPTLLQFYGKLSGSQLLFKKLHLTKETFYDNALCQLDSALKYNYDSEGFPYTLSPPHTYSCVLVLGVQSIIMHVVGELLDVFVQCLLSRILRVRIFRLNLLDFSIQVSSRLEGLCENIAL